MRKNITKEVKIQMQQIRKDMTSEHRAALGKGWAGISDEKLKEAIVKKEQRNKELQARWLAEQGYEEEQIVSPWGVNLSQLSFEDKGRLAVMQAEEQKKADLKKQKELKKWNKSVLEELMEEI